jgi:ankyrin repeat protein
MQQTPIRTFSNSLLTAPALNGPAGNNAIVSFEVDQQSTLAAITFMVLPAEVLAYIMHKVDNPIMLSMTCQKLRALYHNPLVYTPHKRQAHRLTYSLPNLNITALREKLAPLPTEKGCRVIIPEVDTPEWLELRYNRHYVRSPLDTVKDTYIMAWELLLRPGAIDDRAYTSELMRLILELVHYVDADQYVAQLFAGDFPQDFFAQLADIHVDRCLRLVAHYFPIKKNSPAYAFFLQQSPLIDRVGYSAEEGYHSIGYMSLKEQPSLFFLVIEGFISQPFFSNDQKAPKRYEKLLQILLTGGCDLEQSNEHGETALLYLLSRASKVNTIKEQVFVLVNLLLESGVNCNTTTKQGDNILSYAMQTCCLPLIKHLLSFAQIDSQLIKQHKASALLFAIAADDLPTFKALLGQFTLYDDIRICAFLYTLWCKKDGMAEQIADAFLGGLTANEKQNFINRTLSHTIEYCSAEEFRELVPVLLQYGADCNTGDRMSDTTALMQACAYQQEEVVKLLLQQPNIAINAINIGYGCALETAISSGNLSILQALLAYPNINIDDFYSGTPLDHAVRRGSPEVVKLLVQALLTQAPSDVVTAQARDDNIVQSFLTIDETDPVKRKEMQNAFLYSMNAVEKKVFIDNIKLLAMGENRSKIVAFLSEEAEGNIADEKGKTALMTACRSQQVEVVKNLLPHFAINLNIRDNKGRTALYYAVEQGNTSIVQALLQHNTIEEAELFTCAFFNAIHCKNKEINTIFWQLMQKPLQIETINSALGLAMAPC